MKQLLSILVLASVFTLNAVAADVSTTLSNVHLCCPKCATAVEKAVGKVDGATASVDRDAKTVTITGPDEATVQKAVDALIDAGYYGKSSNAEIKVKTETGAKGEKVKTLEVSNVHLCCDKCVKVVNAALMEVPGVQSTTAAKGAKSFTITGDFDDKEALAALQKAGLTGEVK